MAKVTIKKGNKKIISDDLASINHAPDGIVFNFTDQSFFHVIDRKIPIEIKERLVTTDQNFHEHGNLIIDLDNLKQPVYVDLTKE